MGDELFRAFISRLDAIREFTPVAQRFYSHVYRIPSRVIKIITSHRVLSPEGFNTKSEAGRFGTEIFTYMEKLGALGVPISPVSETNMLVLSGQETGRPFIVLDAPDGGASVEMLLEQSNSDAAIRDLAVGMMRAVLPVLQQQKLAHGYPEVGIDATPGNFTLVYGSIMYIDFTPPRYFSPDRGYRIEYPQPEGEEEIREGLRRYYEPDGVLTRWLTDCCRIRPDKRSLFLAVLRDTLPYGIWGPVIDALCSVRLPAELHAREWETAIESARQPFELRDLACAMAAVNGSDPVSAKRWLDEFFHASRHHPGKPVPQEQFSLLKMHLRDRRISLLVETEI